MKELKFGEYALMGKDKLKRIYLGYANGKHHSVHNRCETLFELNEEYEILFWVSAEPIEEPVYYYQWEKASGGVLSISSYITDKNAETYDYARDGWKRNDSTKREALK